MNRSIIVKGILATILVIAISCSSSNPPAETTTTTTNGLSVSVATSTAGGSYSPRNVVAIWVENSAGTFIKSMTVYAEARKYDLTRWSTASAGNTVDAKTGATQSSFGTVTGTWNGKDTKGTIVPDGSYKVCMELTDKQGTGNFSSFAFTKGTTAVTLAPANVSSFSNISIKWMPL